MLILWRALLIILSCLAVAICYPYYANGAITIMLTWAAIAFCIMALLTVITKALYLGKSHIFNSFLDIALVICFIYILLNIFPQQDGSTPYMNLKKGIYPNKQDIQIGLENLGFTKRKESLEQLQNNINELTSGLNKIKTLIPQEHKD